MSKPNKVDQDAAANQALAFTLKTTQHILKSNEARKIRVALDSYDTAIEAMLHLMVPLLSIGTRLQIHTENSSLPRHFRRGQRQLLAG